MAKPIRDMPIRPPPKPRPPPKASSGASMSLTPQEVKQLGKILGPKIIAVMQALQQAGLVPGAPKQAPMTPGPNGESPLGGQARLR
jgi:hypothetical protein